jgi:hypothetical protein
MGIPDTTGLQLPAFDVIGSPRVCDGNDDGLIFIDMGAYEYTPLSVGYAEPVSDDEISDLLVYPNPTDGKVEFSFYVSSLQRISVKIFDHNGRLVATAIDRQVPAGKQILRFDAGNIAQGIYFVKKYGIEDSNPEVKKLVVVR